MDDGLSDLPFQERCNILAMWNVFVILCIVAVRPLDREDFWPISQSRF